MKHETRVKHTRFGVDGPLIPEAKFSLIPSFDPLFFLLQNAGMNGENMFGVQCRLIYQA